MATVNRVPRGLLGLLDAKTLGRTPEDSAGILSPTIDLTPNYLADIPIETAQASGVGGTPGTNYGVVEVPAGELWYVFHISAELIFTSAAKQTGFPVLVTPSGVVSVPLADSNEIQATAAIGESWTRVLTFPTPMLVGPGTQFATRVGMISGSVTNNITSVIYRSVNV